MEVSAAGVDGTRFGTDRRSRTFHALLSGPCGARRSQKREVRAPQACSGGGRVWRGHRLNQPDHVVLEHGLDLVGDVVAAVLAVRRNRGQDAGASCEVRAETVRPRSVITVHF